MHIALFGATGGTGRQVLAQALEQGHTITALARDPNKLQPHDGLTQIGGDVLDPAAVAKSVEGADAVICVLGSHGRQEPIEARGTERILAAMQAAGVRRLVVVSSLGVGDSRAQIAWPFRLVMDLMLKTVLEAKAEQEQLVMASGLDWVIVRPGGLTDGPRTSAYRFGVDPTLKSGRIARADVADFVLRQLTDDSFLHQTPAVT
ncbi:SDR family oxidoreductase [Thiorhodococcus mannitoliphagus]|uniref:SDR family oxidoreductase n=1 Tax=Thiorhodococcus mannitoliphagus TaxID=329406 RepID=A0A6P1DZC5_9GAMM|nr:NAD(P)-binding oxidoreductase [Thiorhodococcus mannitoliphagus]NEX22413.1 SDR family oxidoreductase [Thiorhodococcus mannitoliphagus]